jgi:hypothetical protein
MATHRLLPPVAGPRVNQQTLTNGRSYQAAPGTPLDVPDYDAQGLVAAGWTFVSLSGPTSARPTGSLGMYPLAQGLEYFDTTLNAALTYDGSAWRDGTGAAR